MTDGPEKDKSGKDRPLEKEDLGEFGKPKFGEARWAGYKGQLMTPELLQKLGQVGKIDKNQSSESDPGGGLQGMSADGREEAMSKNPERPVEELTKHEKPNDNPKKEDDEDVETPFYTSLSAVNQAIEKNVSNLAVGGIPPVILMMIGMPAGGKTTTIKRLMKYFGHPENSLGDQIKRTVEASAYVFPNVERPAIVVDLPGEGIRQLLSKWTAPEKHLLDDAVVEQFATLLKKCDGYIVCLDAEHVLLSDYDETSLSFTEQHSEAAESKWYDEREKTLLLVRALDIWAGMDAEIESSGGLPADGVPAQIKPTNKPALILLTKADRYAQALSGIEPARLWPTFDLAKVQFQSPLKEWSDTFLSPLTLLMGIKKADAQRNVGRRWLVEKVWTGFNNFKIDFITAYDGLDQLTGRTDAVDFAARKIRTLPEFGTGQNYDWIYERARKYRSRRTATVDGEGERGDRGPIGFWRKTARRVVPNRIQRWLTWAAAPTTAIWLHSAGYKESQNFADANSIFMNGARAFSGLETSWFASRWRPKSGLLTLPARWANAVRRAMARRLLGIAEVDFRGQLNRVYIPTENAEYQHSDTSPLAMDADAKLDAAAYSRTLGQPHERQHSTASGMMSAALPALTAAALTVTVFSVPLYLAGGFENILNKAPSQTLPYNLTMNSDHFREKVIELPIFRSGVINGSAEAWNLPFPRDGYLFYLPDEQITMRQHRQKMNALVRVAKEVDTAVLLSSFAAPVSAEKRLGQTRPIPYESNLSSCFGGLRGYGTKLNCFGGPMQAVAPAYHIALLHLAAGESEIAQNYLSIVYDKVTSRIETGAVYVGTAWRSKNFPYLGASVAEEANAGRLYQVAASSAYALGLSYMLTKDYQAAMESFWSALSWQERLRQGGSHSLAPTQSAAIRNDLFVSTLRATEGDYRKLKAGETVRILSDVSEFEGNSIDQLVLSANRQILHAVRPEISFQLNDIVSEFCSVEDQEKAKLLTEAEKSNRIMREICLASILAKSAIDVADFGWQKYSSLSNMISNYISDYGASGLEQEWRVRSMMASAPMGVSFRCKKSSFQEFCERHKDLIENSLLWALLDAGLTHPETLKNLSSIVDDNWFSVVAQWKARVLIAIGTAGKIWKEPTSGAYIGILALLILGGFSFFLVFLFLLRIQRNYSTVFLSNHTMDLAAAVGRK